MKLSVAVERFPILNPFTIARGSKTEAVVVTATVSDNGLRGWGECVPYARYGETADSVVAAIESIRSDLENGMDRATLQTRLPAGAARAAVDCALWDFEAKQSGASTYARVGVANPGKLTTAFTISLDDPSAMAAAARAAAARPLLKIKLGSPGGDIERIHAVREAAPQATLIADANEGWNESNLDSHFEACRAAGFALIEQPLPQKMDEALRGRGHPVPLCADESVHDRGGLERLVGLYEFVNIKLDKTGGLTEALALADEALSRGLGLMVGCMVGTSLAMAPAMALALAKKARFVDLDGPLLLAKDREGGMGISGSEITPPALWGFPT